MLPCRHLLILWTFSLSVLLYVDRICISTAKTAIARDLKFSDVDMGWVLSAFALGYALCQTPGGWLADRFGPRISLSAIVVFWSVFTGLTATVTGWWNMLLTRFLFGAGEAGAFPGVARATFSWIPISERGFLQGINFSGSRIGGAASMIVLPVMIDQLGWRGSFVTLMFLGFGWAAGWFWWFRNDPADHAGVSPAELATIKAGQAPAKLVTQSDGKPTELKTAGQGQQTDNLTETKNQGVDTPRSPKTDRDWPTNDQRADQQIKHPPNTVTSPASNMFWELAGSKNLWLISAQYFSSNFTFFFCLTWLFPHLNKTYQLSGVQAGLYSATPLVCGAMGNWFSGWLVDRIYQTGHWTASRRNPAILGFGLATAGLLASVAATTPLWTIIWFSLAVFGADMTISPSWSFCIDIGQARAGVVSGAMNMAGNVGSFVTALAFPYLAAWTGSNTPFFFVAAGLNLLAIPLWMLVDPRRPLRSCQ